MRGADPARARPGAAGVRFVGRGRRRWPAAGRRSVWTRGVPTGGSGRGVPAGGARRVARPARRPATRGSVPGDARRRRSGRTRRRTRSTSAARSRLPGGVGRVGTRTGYPGRESTAGRAGATGSGVGSATGGSATGISTSAGGRTSSTAAASTFLGRRQGVDLLLDLGKRRRARPGPRRPGAGPAALGDARLDRVDLVRFQAAELVLDVVPEVPAVIQDGLGLQPERLGQFEDAHFLGGSLQPSGSPPGRSPRPASGYRGKLRGDLNSLGILTGSTDPGRITSRPPIAGDLYTLRPADGPYWQEVAV